MSELDDFSLDDIVQQNRFIRGRNPCLFNIIIGLSGGVRI